MIPARLLDTGMAKGIRPLENNRTFYNKKAKYRAPVEPPGSMAGDSSSTSTGLPGYSRDK